MDSWRETGATASGAHVPVSQRDDTATSPSRPHGAPTSRRFGPAFTITITVLMTDLRATHAIGPTCCDSGSISSVQYSQRIALPCRPHSTSASGGRAHDIDASFWPPAPCESPQRLSSRRRWRAPAESPTSSSYPSSWRAPDSRSLTSTRTSSAPILWPARGTPARP
jgi:hypothetical protein